MRKDDIREYVWLTVILSVSRSWNVPKARIS